MEVRGKGEEDGTGSVPFQNPNGALEKVLPEVGFEGGVGGAQWGDPAGSHQLYRTRS